MINLDNAAAARLDAKALEAMLPYLTGDEYLNPSAAYLPALAVARKYEAAKNQIASLVNASGNNLIMTSGATEANNLALSAARGFAGSAVLVSPFEHPSVVASAAHGCGSVEVLRATPDGFVDLTDLAAHVTDETVLVSVALTSGDLGTIQPIREISEIIHRTRQERIKRDLRMPIWLHVDASQGLEVLEVNIARLGADMLTLNSGKLHGPKGVGALFVAPAMGINLTPLIYGGGQEAGMRSGTENVAGVMGFAEAVRQIAKHRKATFRQLQEYKTELRAALVESFGAGVVFLGNPKKQLVSHLPISFPDYDAERLIFALENSGILVSTGSACAARKNEVSPALRAIGATDEVIAGSLRISLSSENSCREIPRIISALRLALTDENRAI
ncbi:MAG: aminotransferase class V-fold PLP-dependent enzyme [Candidatus Nomurabacteria bacterium]|jgi:cysteine desulfurase|nr:aminotransferase class V-fold PLP-dependent enzyme [Candidatus Nomurabacteria bacterium]